MLSVEAVGVMVKLLETVAPSVVAVTVAEPTFPPETTLVNIPLASVTPDEGVNVTVPVPDCVNTTSVLGTAVPDESLAVTFNVDLSEPLSDKLPFEESIVAVEPVI